MAFRDSEVGAITQGMHDALKAMGGQRKSPMELAMTRKPETEIVHCAYLASLALPRATGAAAAPAAEAWRLLRQVRATLQPHLEQYRVD